MCIYICGSTLLFRFTRHRRVHVARPFSLAEVWKKKKKNEKMNSEKKNKLAKRKKVKKKCPRDHISWGSALATPATSSSVKGFRSIGESRKKIRIPYPSPARPPSSLCLSPWPNKDRRIYKKGNHAKLEKGMKNRMMKKKKKKCLQSPRAMTGSLPQEEARDIQCPGEICSRLYTWIGHSRGCRFDIGVTAGFLIPHCFPRSHIDTHARAHMSMFAGTYINSKE